MIQADTVSHALRRCRPLDDPAASWAKVTTSALLISVGIHFLITIIAIFSTDNLETTWRQLVATVAVAVFSWLVLHPVLRLARLPKILYLRAFSTDRSTKGKDPARDMLRKVLPKGLALGGIRPPGFRAPWWSRWLLGNSATAYRYLGSNMFELEAADHNWYARLLASISRAHALVIDMRSLTPFVHDEIKLAGHIAKEPNRVFLLVDDSQDSSSWVARFIDASGCDAERAGNVATLTLPANVTETQRPALDAMKLSLGEIPAHAIHVDAACLEEAKLRVSAENWPTPWWQISALQTIFSTVLLSSISFFIGDLFKRTGWWTMLPLLTMGGLVLFLYFGCLLRIIRLAGARKRLGLASSPSRSAAWVAVLAWLAVVFLFLMPAVLAIRIAQNRANRMMAIVQVTSLSQSVEMFYSEYAYLPSEMPVLHTDEPEGIEFLRVLFGEEDVKDPLNKAAIRFLNVKTVTEPRDGLHQDANGVIKGLFDPWGNPYTVFLDAEYSERFTYRYGTNEMEALGRKCVVFSAGPDGEEGTSDDISSEP